MNINWYPGHMKKTTENIKKNLSLIDVIFEILDARIPISSKNPNIDQIIGSKPKLIILNKSDLSNKDVNKMWKDFFLHQGFQCAFINSLNRSSTNDIIKLTHKLTENKRKSLERKGIKNRPIRAMVVGIPNVGKSTFINNLTGKKRAKTGNKPGVTKGNQWIKLKGNLELMDTPGVLWPKFEDKDVGLNLAFTGAIKDEILDIETLALKLVETLSKNYPKLLKNRYNVEIENKTSLQLLQDIAINRGCILKGKEVDFNRVSGLIIDEFRKGKIGKITLEFPQ